MYKKHTSDLFPRPLKAGNFSKNIMKLIDQCSCLPKPCLQVTQQNMLLID